MAFWGNASIYINITIVASSVALTYLPYMYVPIQALQIGVEMMKYE